MSDLTYRLIVDMSSQGSLSKDLEKVGSAATPLDKLKGTLRDVGASATGMFEGAVEKAAGLAVGLAKIGVGAGIAAVAYGVGGLNAELEKTTVSLAAVFTAQGQSANMEQGMTKASSVLKEMRKDAAALPGEFEDLMGFFRLGAAPGFNAGASIKQLEKLSANAMATAAATGMDMGQASREFAQLIQGRSGSHNVFGSMLGITGEASKKFNAATGEERLKTLETEFGKYEGSIKVFATTFDALKSTMVDNLKNVTRQTTAPLFERVKTTLGEANSWFDANGDRVENMSERVGQALGWAFDVGKRKVLEWGPLVFEFADRAEKRIGKIWERIGPIAGALEGKAQAFMRHGGSDVLLDGMGNAGKLYGGLKLASAVAPVAMAAGEYGAGALGAAGMGPGLLVALAALVAVGGAVHALTDETSAYHDKAVHIAGSIKEHFGATYTHLESAFTKLEPALLTIADIMGVSFLRSIELLAYVLEGMAAQIDMVASAFVAAKVALGGQGLNKVNEAIDPARQPYDIGASKLGVMALNGYKEGEADAAKKTDKKSVHGHGGTNIQKVEIVVSSNQDPSRIARLTVKELADMARNPTSSRNVKNWGAARPGD